MIAAPSPLPALGGCREPERAMIALSLPHQPLRLLARWSKRNVSASEEAM